MPAMLFHHSRPLEHVSHGSVRQIRRADDTSAPPPAPTCDNRGEWHDQRWFEAAEDWAAERIGYRPVFLAVGRDEDALWVTGYADQWRRVVRSPLAGGMVYRAAGDVPNRAVFSWSRPPATSIVYSSIQHWCAILNSIRYTCDGARHGAMVVDAIDRSVLSGALKAHWGEFSWRRAVRRYGSNLQALVPALDLTSAERIWCRNAAAAQSLVSLGFDRSVVAVRRIPIPWPS